MLNLNCKYYFELQITADEAIFSLIMMLQRKQYSHLEINTSNKQDNMRRREKSYLPHIPASASSADSTENLGILLSQAYQRLLAYQSEDGSFSFVKWGNR